MDTSPSGRRAAVLERASGVPMDDVDRLIGGFRQREIDAKTLVSRLAELRKVEEGHHELDLEEAARVDAWRVPQASLGHKGTDARNRLIPEVELRDEPVPDTIARARE